MGNFSYNFCVTLLHSLWQSALLYFLFLLLYPAFKKTTPLIKRNFLFQILIIQFLLSIATFLFLFSGSQENYTTNIFFGNWMSPATVEAAPWLLMTYFIIVCFRSFFLIYS